MIKVILEGRLPLNIDHFGVSSCSGIAQHTAHINVQCADSMPKYMLEYPVFLMKGMDKTNAGKL